MSLLLWSPSVDVFGLAVLPFFLGILYSQFTPLETHFEQAGNFLSYNFKIQYYNPNMMFK